MHTQVQIGKGYIYIFWRELISDIFVEAVRLQTVSH